MELISVKNLNFSINDTRILEGINLTVSKGEFLGLIGPNGAGKTTLLKILLGIYKNWTGEVSVFGVDPRSLGEKRRLIGYLPHQKQFDPNFPVTVFDVVLMGRIAPRGYFKILNKNDRKTAADLLKTVEMLEFRNRQIGQLSDGQQQRVFIARALASNPQLLILDEPTIGVDVAAQESFIRFIMKLKKDLNLTIIMVSHDLSLISSYSDKIACLNKKLFCHDIPETIDHDTLKQLYGEDVEILVHGEIPHRTVKKHDA